jgi:hypothetical protein
MITAYIILEEIPENIRIGDFGPIIVRHWSTTLDEAIKLGETYFERGGWNGAKILAFYFYEDKHHLHTLTGETQ